jgi:hypothetical protein
VKISELQGILSKASQLLGDAPIIFKAVESEAETAFHAIEVSITSSDPTEPGTVTLVHGPAQTPAPAGVADPLVPAAPAEPTPSA